MALNQTERSRVDRSLSPNFGWQRSAKNVKFTEEYVIYTEDHILEKKSVYK